MHVPIEHVNQKRIVRSLQSKQGLPPSLFKNGKKRCVLEGTRVNKLLNLDMIVMKRNIKMITRLLRVETLHKRIKKVKETLKNDVLNRFR